ncbi:uncharacterized protein LOC132728932 [Ruditapes philippinarum]|uniref:uncharacterized protein LOC132728932 n=1 Tax=Ruditapes philippinarum TaxID=129788 RepID=UPI00295B5FA4|nr:uncharacterized protein LOC132728932 [Ruditapes philippinarum]
MATLDEERYLRHIWLLGEGGLFVLRGLISREVTNSGSTLDNLLQNGRALFRSILREQNQHLFPSSTTVNADIYTWDMSLLLCVLKRMFWSSLSLAEKASIRTLKTFRDDFQGHPTIMTMSESDYSINRQLLEQSLRHISSKINANVEIEVIINRTASGNIDVQSAFKHIKEIHDFKTSFLCALEDKFQQITPKLSSIDTTTTAIQEKQERIIRSLTELKNLNVQKTKHEFKRELITILHTGCDNEENKKKATDVLFDFVKIIQSKSTFSDEEVKDIIRTRIEWYGNVSLDLMDDVTKWFGDINGLSDTIPGYPYLGSIRVPIYCTSVTGILQFLNYLNGNQCRHRLSSISSSISTMLGFTCSFTWTINPVDLQNVFPSFCLKCRYSDKEKTQPTDKKAGLQSSFHGIQEDPYKEETEMQFAEVVQLPKTTIYETLMSAETHSILCDEKDHRRSDVIGIDVLPNGYILIVCFFDKKILKLNKNFEVIADCILPGHPNDVCYIGNGKAALCLDYDDIVIVDISNYLVVGGLLKIQKSCSCIACYDNLLYIGDRKGCVFTYSLDTYCLVRCLHKWNNFMHSPRGNIAISKDGQNIFIKYGQGLRKLDIHGNIISAFQIGENKSPSPFCVIYDGTILSCDFYTCNLRQIEHYDGLEVRQKQIFEEPKLISSMCYDKKHSRLLIADCLMCVHEFKLDI